MKNQVTNTPKILIVAGRFEGNCSNCVYANHRDVDVYGRIKCNYYGTYNKIEDRNGCFHYERR